MGHWPNKVCVVLGTAERQQLAAVAGDRNRLREHDRAGAHRARLCRSSVGAAVAQSVGLSRPTVWRWQQRFAESGVEGLLRDKTRKPGKAARHHAAGDYGRGFSQTATDFRLGYPERGLALAFCDPNPNPISADTSPLEMIR
jgi:hypothetical protein